MSVRAQVKVQIIKKKKNPRRKSIRRRGTKETIVLPIIKPIIVVGRAKK